jgi:biotin synthase
MTFREGKCTANCRFCPQARESSSRADMLSRISWPEFQTGNVLRRLQEAVARSMIGRVCIQALNYPEVFSHLCALVKAVREEASAPVSVSCQPLTKRNVKLLADAGAERIGIPLDAATEELFERVKGKGARGPYDWNNQLELLEEAVGIFSRGKVSTHLIANLGETEEQMVGMIQKCVDMGVLPALFSFTPISGTALAKRKQPSVDSYRRLQLARKLILDGTARFDDMGFDGDGRLIDFGVERQVLVKLVRTGEPFLTSGCPSCNRPYYNEKPSGPIYNYPRGLSLEELEEIEKRLRPQSGA